MTKPDGDTMITAEHFIAKHCTDAILDDFRALTDADRRRVLEEFGSPCSTSGSLDCLESCCDPYAHHGEDA